MAVAGTVTVAPADIGGGYTQYTLTWLCNASGVVSENPATIKRGRIHQVEFVPDAGGTQPTDLYDVTLLNAITGPTGVDLMGGLGANVSNAARKADTPLSGTAVPIFHRGGILYLTIANAGNAKGGVVILIVGP